MLGIHLLENKKAVVKNIYRFFEFDDVSPLYVYRLNFRVCVSFYVSSSHYHLNFHVYFSFMFCFQK